MRRRLILYTTPDVRICHDVEICVVHSSSQRSHNSTDVIDSSQRPTAVETLLVVAVVAGDLVKLFIGLTRPANNRVQPLKRRTATTRERAILG